MRSSWICWPVIIGRWFVADDRASAGYYLAGGVWNADGVAGAERKLFDIPMKKLILTFIIALACSSSVFSTTVTISAYSLTNLPFNPSGIGSARSITVTATNGSATVTSSAAFPSNIVGIAGFQVLIGGTQYVVSSIASTSSLTLTSAFSGSTGSQTMTLYPYVLLKMYATAGFQDNVTGQNIQPGTPGSGNFYKQVAVSVINSGSGNVAWIPEFTIPSTTDALINNQARYVFGFYRSDSSFLAFYLCGAVQQLAIQATTPTTWTAICNFNAPGGIVPPNNDVYTKAQMDARLPSCTANQIIYAASTGNVYSCLTVGAGLQISGGSLSSTSSGGTVTSFSSGNLSPLFTTSVATATSTPALSFSLSTQTANTIFAGPTSGGVAAPSFRALVAADLPAGTGTVTGSGTTNYVPYWTSSSALGASNLIYDIGSQLYQFGYSVNIFTLGASSQLKIDTDQIVLEGSGTRANSAIMQTMKATASQTGAFQKFTDSTGASTLFQVDVDGDVRPRGVNYTWPAASSSGVMLNTSGTLTWNTTTGTGSSVLATSPTIVTPTIADLTNATHTHQSTAGGGTLDAAAIAAGTLPVARGGTGATTFTTNGVLYGNSTSAVQVTAAGGVGTLCLVSTNGAAPVFGSCSGSAATALSSITAASAGNTITSGDNAQVWQWQLTTNGKTAFSFSENLASSATSSYLFNVNTIATSTAKPIKITSGGTTDGVEMSTAGSLGAIGAGGIVATTGDSATAFFSTGTLENARLDSDLQAIGDNSTNGIYARTGTGTVSARTMTGTTNVITVTNGDGVSGNPTFTVGSLVVRTDQANTYSTGAQDFTSATSMTLPVSAGANPTADGAIAYDSTAAALEYGDGGTNRTVANLNESQTFTNKTLSTGTVVTAATMTLGSDGTGDIYYRAVGGALTRLGIGSSNQLLTVSGGLPSWTSASSVALPQATQTSSNYTQLTTDWMTSVDTSGGNRTVTLYAAAGNSGRLTSVCKVTTDANTVTITDGTLSEVIYAPTACLQFLSNGSDWKVQSY